jgi:glycosyltransferase involved in cell wall biosynthesis
MTPKHKTEVLQLRRLRIAIFSEACAAGTGRNVMDLAIYLTQEGHDVHLLYSPWHTDDRFRAALSHFSGLGGRSQAIKIHHNVHPADLNAIWDVRHYLMTRGTFDIFHCHSTKAGFVGRLASLGMKMPKIYTPHAFLTMSPVADCFSQQGAHVVERSLAMATDVFICVSEEEMDHARIMGIASHKLRLVPNGMPLADAHEPKLLRSTVRKELGLSDGDICIGSVGRLVRQKAYHVAVEAFARAASQLDERVKMIVVGDGPLLHKLKTKARKVDAQGRVRFVGEMPGLRTMSAFDIFAVSSYYEGHPYSYIEALALGLPIVTTAVGGSKMSVHDGVNGFVCPVGDVDAMANSFVKLVQSPLLREQMSRASSGIANDFTLDNMLRRTRHVYEGTLQTRAYLSQVTSAGN